MAQNERLERRTLQGMRTRLEKKNYRRCFKHVRIYLVTQSLSAIFQCGQKHKCSKPPLNSSQATSCNASGRLEITFLLHNFNSMAIRIDDHWWNAAVNVIPSYDFTAINQIDDLSSLPLSVQVPWVHEIYPTMWRAFDPWGPEFAQNSVQPSRRYSKK